MRSGPLRLDLMMQLVDISADCKKDALCQYVFLSTVQIPTKIHVLFDVCKGTFRLNAPVHPQLCAIFTDDSFQILLPFLLHEFGHI